jgi:hypothetical protein
MAFLPLRVTAFRAQRAWRLMTCQKTEDPRPHPKNSFPAQLGDMPEGFRKQKYVLPCRHAQIPVKPPYRNRQHTYCILHSCTSHHGPTDSILESLALQTQRNHHYGAHFHTKPLLNCAKSTFTLTLCLDIGWCPSFGNQLSRSSPSIITL